MDLEPLVRILVAMGLAIPVGLDRELRGQPAGPRTHVVVATASAALGYVSIVGTGSSDVSDQTRIAAQVVSGIGFMGAGVIFASSGRVHGLTTAAALFSAMAIGLCAGMGAFGIAIALVVVTVFVLGPLDWLSGRLIGGHALDERTIQVVAKDLGAVGAAQRLLAEHGAPSREVALEPFGDEVVARIMTRCRDETAREVFRALADLDGIGFVSDQSLIPEEADTPEHPTATIGSAGT